VRGERGKRRGGERGKRRGGGVENIWKENGVEVSGLRCRSQVSGKWGMWREIGQNERKHGQEDIEVA
jgi:hypothetical protein